MRKLAAKGARCQAAVNRHLGRPFGLVPVFTGRQHSNRNLPLDRKSPHKRTGLGSRFHARPRATGPIQGGAAAEVSGESSTPQGDRKRGGSKGATAANRFVRPCRGFPWVFAFAHPRLRRGLDSCRRCRGCRERGLLTDTFVM